VNLARLRWRQLLLNGRYGIFAGMMRGSFTAMVVFLVATTFDQHFANGMFTDATLTILAHVVRLFS
jgi:hypothetical protein